jgi:UDP-N-acetylmuramyl pentapeptide synthase
VAIEVIPDELVAAAAPLRAAGQALRDLGDARRAVLGLLTEVPSAELREAFGQYVKAWSHVALDSGDEARELAEALGYAAGWYADREAALARGFSFSRRMP